MNKDLKDVRLYAVANMAGDFADCERYQKKDYFRCGWGVIEVAADLFRDYKDAYAHAKRINKGYGYEICRVVRLEPRNYKSDYWERMKEAETCRDRAWWKQDYRRHEYSGVKF